MFDLSHPKAPAADVAVIGAGAIGLSIAWRACRRGLRVVVLERDTAGAGASHVAAGMLAPIAEAIAAEQPLLELGLASAREYPRFVSELCAEAELADVGYTPCGTLLVARDARRSRGARARVRAATALWPQRRAPATEPGAGARARARARAAPRARRGRRPRDRPAGPDPGPVRRDRARRRRGPLAYEGRRGSDHRRTRERRDPRGWLGAGGIGGRDRGRLVGGPARRNPRPGSPCARSRARSCACTTRPAPGC